MSAELFPPPGEYERVAARLEKSLRSCVLCPRRCRVDRLAGELGFCRAAAQTAAVNTSQLHFGEEPPISGTKGSGTVFFAGCTLACRFCQNWQISQAGGGEETSPQDLAGVFLGLEMAGAHNINLVTPTPHLVVILKALAIARGYGLALPVVYNTSGYESAAVLRQMEGLIDIYLPDLKYADEAVAERLSQAANYVAGAQSALAEMHRQVGNLKLEDDGIAYRGVMVRHLVLPNGLSGSPQVLARIAEICGPGAWVSLMSQYFPTYKAAETPGMERRIKQAEYQEATEAMQRLGLSRGYVQGLASATEKMVPRWRE
ncbi:radical SAM protein [Desulfoferula mesophila]|uniref:Radical SAM protein n=1 Tax=Desulfoferula mesophila TaxID=3058419 RepID=A0AAU9EFX0_9BACT|nr:radical SAM protein [Desulfoferula mesophilus]